MKSEQVISTNTAVVRSPTRDECVLRYLLEHRAAQIPDHQFGLFDDNSEWTYAQALKDVQKIAAGLQALDVKQGDFVVGWLPNSKEAILAWFAVNYIGAVYVPLNVSFRGTILGHCLNIAQAKLAIVHAGLVERLTELDQTTLEHLVVVGGLCSNVPTGLGVTTWADMDTDCELNPLDTLVEPWDPTMIVFSSGTTGPSKGVLNSYTQLYLQNVGVWHIESSDRYLLYGPLFHVGAAGTLFATLVAGSTFALVESFKTQNFWSEIKRTGATGCALIGVMLDFLMEDLAQADKNSSLRWICCSPHTERAVEFAKHFNIELHTGYASTEQATPIVADGPVPLGACGKLRKGFEARIVDANDNPLPIGEVGELLIRSDFPWALFTEYKGDPEATAKAWRNGWFHTGDLMRQDDAGYFFFMGRLKDAIRRRGENISAFEVEAEIMKFPGIREAAVVGVADGAGEEEVLACISTYADRMVDPSDLAVFLRPLLPHFMIPRYIRIMSELPKTSSNRVQKYLLREAHLVDDVWDARKFGLVAKRDNLA